MEGPARTPPQKKSSPVPLTSNFLVEEQGRNEERLQIWGWWAVVVVVVVFRFFGGGASFAFLLTPHVRLFSRHCLSCSRDFASRKQRKQKRKNAQDCLPMAPRFDSQEGERRKRERKREEEEEEEGKGQPREDNQRQRGCPNPPTKHTAEVAQDGLRLSSLSAPRLPSGASLGEGAPRGQRLGSGASSGQAMGEPGTLLCPGWAANRAKLWRARTRRRRRAFPLPRPLPPPSLSLALPKRLLAHHWPSLASGRRETGAGFLSSPAGRPVG